MATDNSIIDNSDEVFTEWWNKFTRVDAILPSHLRNMAMAAWTAGFQYALSLNSKPRDIVWVRDILALRGRVRRKAWAAGTFISGSFEVGGSIRTDEDKPWAVTPEDLLANDWEVVE